MYFQKFGISEQTECYPMDLAIRLIYIKIPCLKNMFAKTQSQHDEKCCFIQRFKEFYILLCFISYQNVMFLIKTENYTIFSIWFLSTRPLPPATSGRKLHCKINTHIITHVLKKPCLTVDNASLISDCCNYMETELLTTTVLKQLGKMPDSFNLCFITPLVFLAPR